MGAGSLRWCVSAWDLCTQERKGERKSREGAVAKVKDRGREYLMKEVNTVASHLQDYREI